MPRISQITLLTWAERIGRSVGRAERRTALVGDDQGHVVDAVLVGARREQHGGPAVRPGPRSLGGPSIVSRSSARAPMADGHRLVELVGDRGREPAARAGEGDRAGRLDVHRPEPALDPRPGPRRRTRGSRSGRVRAEYDTVPSASSVTVAGDRVVEGQQVLQGDAGCGSGRRRSRSSAGRARRPPATSGSAGSRRPPWSARAAWLTACTEVRSSQSSVEAAEERPLPSGGVPVVREHHGQRLPGRRAGTAPRPRDSIRCRIAVIDVRLPGPGPPLAGAASR